MKLHDLPILGYVNRFETGSISAGSSIQAAPPSNLSSQIGSEVWQTAGARTPEQGAWLELNAGQPVNWRAFALTRTNLTSMARAWFKVGERRNALWQDGEFGNYASASYNPKSDLTSDLTLVIHVAPTTWVADFRRGLLNKRVSGSGGGGYDTFINPDGSFRLQVNDSSGNLVSWFGPSIPEVMDVKDGQALWLAVALDADDGSGNSRAYFYASYDGTNWVHLGTHTRNPVVIGVVETSLDVGRQLSAYNRGYIYRAQVWEGSEFELSGGPKGTLLTDFNPGEADVGDTSFISPTGETWTIYGSSTIEDSFLEYYNSDIVEGLVPGIQQLVHVAPEDVIGQRLRIELEDPINPDGFIRAGLAFAGPVFQPERGLSYGARLGMTGARDEVTTRGGQEYPVSLYEQRTWEAHLEYMTEAELREHWFALSRAAERSRNVLFVPRPGSGWEQTESVLGRLRQGRSFEFMEYNTRGWTFSITERL